MAQSNGLHLIRGSHFEIERYVQRLHQPVDIFVTDMAAIFAQMRRDAIGTGFFGHLGRA